MKTVAKRNDMSNTEEKYKHDHLDHGIFGEEVDNKYCNENIDLH